MTDKTDHQAALQIMAVVAENKIPAGGVMRRPDFFRVCDAHFSAA
jgi:hypothetical protein